MVESTIHLQVRRENVYLPYLVEGVVDFELNKYHRLIIQSNFTPLGSFFAGFLQLKRSLGHQ